SIYLRDALIDGAAARRDAYAAELTRLRTEVDELLASYVPEVSSPDDRDHRARRGRGAAAQPRRAEARHGAADPRPAVGAAERRQRSAPGGDQPPLSAGAHAAADDGRRHARRRAAGGGDGVAPRQRTAAGDRPAAAHRARQPRGSRAAVGAPGRRA